MLGRPAIGRIELQHRMRVAVEIPSRPVTGRVVSASYLATRFVSLVSSSFIPVAEIP